MPYHSHKLICEDGEVDKFYMSSGRRRLRRCIIESEVLQITNGRKNQDMVGHVTCSGFPTVIIFVSARLKK